MCLHNYCKKFITFASVCCIALFSFSAQAGAPQGHLDSIESQLKSKIYDEFDYLGRGNESRFSEVAKAFLWDNRDSIRLEKISKSRQADAIVCILIEKYDRSGFAEYEGNDQFASWCQDLIRN